MSNFSLQTLRKVGASRSLMSVEGHSPTPMWDRTNMSARRRPNSTKYDAFSLSRTVSGAESVTCKLRLDSKRCFLFLNLNLWIACCFPEKKKQFVSRCFLVFKRRYCSKPLFWYNCNRSLARGWDAASMSASAACGRVRLQKFFSAGEVHCEPSVSCRS